MYLGLLTFRDWAIIVVAMAVLVLLFAGITEMAGQGGSANWGFGPEWDCTNPGKGGPICFKRDTANP